MALTLNDLFASPDHYLHRFDGDSAIFVPMDRASYHRSIFLDGRISPAGTGEMRIPVATLGAAPPAARIAWIFHVAHCGSTLLARALDHLDLGLVLREPQALRQVALAPDPHRVALVTALIGRRYRATLPTVVKANVPVNFLLPQLWAMDADAPAILLHMPLRDYVLAILRSDNHREWLGRVTAQLKRHLGDLSTASDAQRAAALWRAQIRAFATAARHMPAARSLDAERFFATPARVLSAVAALFGLPIQPARIEEIVAGPLFSTYSKNPAIAFDNQERLTRRAALERRLSTELEQAADWIAQAGDTAEDTAALSRIALLSR